MNTVKVTILFLTPKGAGRKNKLPNLDHNNNGKNILYRLGDSGLE
jgi:hypothetical protein